MNIYKGKKLPIFAYGLRPERWNWRNEDLKGDKRPADPEQVKLCKQWLKRYARPKQRRGRAIGYSSYWLKHRVEAFNRHQYVSNGAFIKAAVDLGYEFVREPDSINVYFYMKLQPEVLKPSKPFLALAT